MKWFLGLVIVAVIVKLIDFLIDGVFRIIDLIKNGDKEEREGMFFNSKTGKLE